MIVIVIVIIIRIIIIIIIVIIIIAIIIIIIIIIMVIIVIIIIIRIMQQRGPMSHRLRHPMSLQDACLTSIVFYNASAVPDEPPPQTFDEFTKCVFVIYCISQFISEARWATA